MQKSEVRREKTAGRCSHVPGCHDRRFRGPGGAARGKASRLCRHARGQACYLVSVLWGGGARRYGKLHRYYLERRNRLPGGAEPVGNADLQRGVGQKIREEDQTGWETFSQHVAWS